MGIGDLIRAAESGGDPNAKNPNSSASGPDQFIDSTWLSTLKQARPDLAQGQSDADLLALKTNPQLSGEMRDFYANQNNGILSNAGHPVTPGNTYLAHFLGPGGAVSMLSADPSAPVASVLPGIMKANPFLQGMTAGDLRAWADRKMGGSQPAQASPASPANTPLQIAPQAAPTFAPQPQQAQAVPQQQEQPQAPLEMPPPMQAIYASPRPRVDLSKLRAAFPQPNFRRG